jgi:hypothetical protein
MRSIEGSIEANCHHRVTPYSGPPGRPLLTYSMYEDTLNLEGTIMSLGPSGLPLESGDCPNVRTFETG